MVSVQDLPTLNAALNAMATVMLCLGYACIRRHRIAAHRACMLTAVAFSTAFLVSYVIYHYHAGSRPYEGQGLVRILYFAILITHVVLAAAIVPLVAFTLSRALRRQFPRHRVIARWTLPLWLYVSVTGIVVYVMLYGV